MNNEAFQKEAQSMVEKAKVAAQHGTKRQLIVRTKEGRQLVETSLTVAAVVGLFLLFTGVLSWPLILIAAIAGIAAKLQVELTSTEDDSFSTTALES